MQALPQLEEAGLVVMTIVGREHRWELVPARRALAEQIVALDAPVTPVLKDSMSESDLQQVALYFATPSSVPEREDDWDESQHALPVGRGTWEDRVPLD